MSRHGLRGGVNQEPAEPRTELFAVGTGHDQLPHDQLPAEVSSFVGRESEIAEIGRLLEAHRLITLTGAPGVGKTRLALRVAAHVGARFEDGVRLVELAGLSEENLVVQAVATALHVRQEHARPLLETLTQALRGQRLLLVLDNCEHVLSACAELADRLLLACPWLAIVATSRQALGISGEVDWPVPPLSTPEAWSSDDPDDLAGYDSVRLFVERAGAVRPGFRLDERNAAAIARICTGLDGLPLAIELAAARTRMIPPSQIAARLRDRFTLLSRGGRTAPARHRTLRALVDWSHDLLSEPEQLLFRRLSVFAGGWTLEAAEAVCASDEGDDDLEVRDAGERSIARARIPRILRRHELFDLLTELVEKSLVVVEERDGDVRYRMLDTLREYAMERLRVSGEEMALRARHQRWILALAEHESNMLTGHMRLGWCDDMNAEIDNIRAALTWGRDAAIRADAGGPGTRGPPDRCESSAVLRALRLAGALCYLWDIRGYLGEGRAWLETLLPLERAIDACDDEERTRARAVALSSLGYLTFAFGDAEVARSRLAEAATLAERIGDRLVRAGALDMLGALMVCVGEPIEATVYVEEALALARSVEAPYWIGSSLYWLAEAARMRGDAVSATALFEQALAVGRQHGLAWGNPYVLDGLARTAEAAGDYERAIALGREALAARAEIRDYRGVAFSFEGLAWSLAASGHGEQAASLLGGATRLRERVGLTRAVLPRWQEQHDAAVAAARAQLGDRAFDAAYEHGGRLPVPEAIDLALGRRRAPNGVPPENTRPVPLTRRERAVVALIGRGLTNRQIAEELVITARTAETHTRNIRQKLGFSSRAQVAAWAVRQGLVPDAD